MENLNWKKPVLILQVDMERLSTDSTSTKLDAIRASVHGDSGDLV